MTSIDQLLQNNRLWAAKRLQRDPSYFDDLAQSQKPKILWIGCSDSRVPAEQLTGSRCGELFVHRNIANQVQPADTNTLSVVQFAIEVLQIQHIIICGHYGCGGIAAATGCTASASPEAPITQWLQPIRQQLASHQTWLQQHSPERQGHLNCELNVLAQRQQLSQTQWIQQAWQQGKAIQLHAWVYDIRNGQLKEVASASHTSESQRETDAQALARLKAP